MNLQPKYINFFLALLCLMISFSAFSQEKNLFRYYDSLTLEQYRQEKWKALIDTSKQAYKQGFDYYYLRMRTGIARFEKENYRRAAKHFRKALDFNDSDPVAFEYMYYSLLYSGREEDALLFYHKNRDLLPEVAGKKKAFRTLAVDLSYHQNTEENQRTLFENAIPAGSVGKQVVTRRFLLGSFYLEHDLTARLRLFHGGTAMKKSNYYYTSSSTNAFDSYDHTIRQFQYYGGLGFIPGKGFYIDAAVHYIHYYSPPLVYRERRFGSVFSVPHEEYDYTLLRMSLWKSIGLFSTGFGFSRSNFNNAIQYQGDYTLTCYPLGNLDLYFLGSFFLLKENHEMAGDDLRLAYKTMAGFKISKQLWLESSLLLGEIKNMGFNEGFVIYNGNETVDMRLDLDLIIPLSTVSYTLKASWLQYTSKFNDLTDNPTELNNIHSDGLTLTGGIKWNF